MPSVPGRARLLTLAVLAAITLLAWLYIAGIARSMQEMATPHLRTWGVQDVVLASVLWWVMMVAMMTPAAAPMIITYDRLRRFGLHGSVGSPRTDVAAFVCGYLLVWGAFAMLAATLQAGLHRAGLMAPDAMRVAPILGGALLVGVGFWQLTPLRDRCLAQCRNPVSFLMSEWRDGSAGALRMGVRHGLWCLGCCWALMMVLFAAGVMNLAWVAILAAWVLLEKTVPAGRWLGRAGGVLAIGWGAWLITRGMP